MPLNIPKVSIKQSISISHFTYMYIDIQNVHRAFVWVTDFNRENIYE